jgi:hypothetical protein
MTVTEYKILLYGTLVLLAVGIPALDAFLNWKYPLPTEGEESAARAFLAAFADNVEQHGEGVIARVRENEPATYLRIASTIIPKELEMAANPIDGLSDDEPEKAIA